MKKAYLVKLRELATVLGGHSSILLVVIAYLNKWIHSPIRKNIEQVMTSFKKVGALTFPIVVAHLPDDFSVSKEPSFNDPDLKESPSHEGLLLAPKDTFFFLHI